MKGREKRKRIEPLITRIRRIREKFWILDFGFWILDFGFWILDFECEEEEGEERLMDEG